MEAELGAIFVNFQRVTAMCMALTEMGCAQPPNPEVTYNATEDIFINYNIRQRRSISINVLFYCVRDRFRQRKFLVYWVSGEQNLADYFTKNHPTSHHRFKRSTYIVPVVDARKCS